MPISSQWAVGSWASIPWIGSGATPTSTVLLTSIIPSRVAFGATSLSLNLSLQYVIPSRIAFGSSALTQSSYVSVFLNGKLIKVLDNSLQITATLSQPTTATFGLWDPTGTIIPQVGQEVLIYLGGQRIFGGLVSQPFQTAFQAVPGLLYSGSGGGSTGGVGSATSGSGQGSGGVACADFSYLLARRYIGLYVDGVSIFPTVPFLSSIVGYIVQTYFAQDGFSYDDSDGDPGINLGPTLFNWVTGQAAFDTLSSATGWDWSVDAFKVIRFFPSTSGSGNSAFDVTDNDGNVYAESLGVEYFQSQYRNKQGVISPTASTALWSDTYSGNNPGPFLNEPQFTDGIRRNFLETYGFTAVPEVTVDGSPQVVAQLTQTGFVPTVFDWYIVQPQPGLPSFGLFQSGSGATLTSAQTLVISYPTSLSPIFWLSDFAQIAERAAIEGNSGVYEDVQQAPSTTTPQAIAQYAAGLLARYGADGIPFQVTYSTRNQKGLFPGQIQHIQVANPPLNFTGMISAVTWQDIDGQFMQLSVTVLSGQYQGNYTQFFQALITQALMAQPSAFNRYTFTVAPTIGGVSNPGITGGNFWPQTIVIQNAVELLYSITVYCPTVVSPETEFDLISIPDLNIHFRVFFPAGTNGTMAVYGQGEAAPSYVYQGQTLQILVGGAVTPVKDVTIVLTTSVAVV